MPFFRKTIRSVGWREGKKSLHFSLSPNVKSFGNNLSDIVVCCLLASRTCQDQASEADRLAGSDGSCRCWNGLRTHPDHHGYLTVDAVDVDVDFDEVVVDGDGDDHRQRSGSLF